MFGLSFGFVEEVVYKGVGFSCMVFLVDSSFIVDFSSFLLVGGKVYVGFGGFFVVMDCF